jgi:arginyl-tRNA synthetase
MQLSSGKMSSRSGNVVTGESFINDIQTEVAKRTDDTEIRDLIAVAAIKYSILKQSTGKNITFDIKKALSFEGDSGPYLQYAHTRAESILKKAEDAGLIIDTKEQPKEITVLEKLMYRFPEVVMRAQEEYEPHYLVTYLTELASEFNSYYAKEKIVDAKEHAQYKLALTRAFQITMKNGLWLLGIETPEKM